MDSKNKAKLSKFIDDMLVMAEEAKQNIKLKKADANDYKLVNTVFKFAIELNKMDAKRESIHNDVDRLGKSAKDIARDIRAGRMDLEKRKTILGNQHLLAKVKRESAQANGPALNGHGDGELTGLF